MVAHTESIQNLVIFPDSGEGILNAIQKVTDKKFTILVTKDMEEAVIFSYQNSPKNSAVILSTASPSYSVWKNFEEKGNLFKQYVNKYSTKNP